MDRKLPLILLALVSLLCVSAGKKPKIFVTFHIEAEQSEGGKFVIPITLGGHTYYFRKVPELTNRQINSFYRFPAKNGRGWGVAFKLDNQGSARLASITTVSVGRRLLTTVNMRPVSFVLVDQPIRHGYAVVWSGITEQDIAMFKKEKLVETDPGGNHKKEGILANDDYLRRNPDEAYDIGEEKKEKRGFRLFGSLFGKKKDKEKKSSNDAPPADDFAPAP